MQIYALQHIPLRRIVGIGYIFKIYRYGLFWTGRKLFSLPSQVIRNINKASEIGHIIIGFRHFTNTRSQFGKPFAKPCNRGKIKDKITDSYVSAQYHIYQIGISPAVSYKYQYNINQVQNKLAICDSFLYPDIILFCLERHSPQPARHWIDPDILSYIKASGPVGNIIKLSACLCNIILWRLLYFFHIKRSPKINQIENNKYGNGKRMQFHDNCAVWNKSCRIHKHCGKSRKICPQPSSVPIFQSCARLLGLLFSLFRCKSFIIHISCFVQPYALHMGKDKSIRTMRCCVAWIKLYNKHCGQN